MVFAQLIEDTSFGIFKYCVNHYNGDYKNRGLTCWKQFFCMAFRQLTHRESLSDNPLGKYFSIGAFLSYTFVAFVCRAPNYCLDDHH